MTNYDRWKLATPDYVEEAAEEMHESGLTIERWNWPFKTAEERKAVAKYFKEYETKEKERMLKDLGQPDW